jgi:tripartite-type tricarboxylate transporter receptor subunit TctC
MPMGRLVALVVAAVALSLQFASHASAQSTYPNRTVRFFLPYGAASATDITARLFADRLSARWGKPVVVENRPGGDGLVSMQAFVAANDDHALWFGPVGAFTVLPYQHDTLPIDPYRDLNPIVSISDVVLAISVPASMNIGSVTQLVALARSEPGKLNAAAANGISDFLLFGFFKNLGLQVAHVPYRDIMQAPGDLAAGRIQVLSTSLAVPQPLAHAGRLKILVVTSKQRAPGEPDIPTAKEAGFPELTFESVGGVFGPRGMPDKLRESIAADFHAVSADPVVAARLASIGTIMDIRGPAAFSKSVQEQRDKLAALAKTLGLKMATQSTQ